MRKIMQLAVLVCFMVNPIVALGDFDKGLAALLKEDYATAYRELLSAAEQGHSAAQFNLGTIFASGSGVAQDYEKAVYWYHQAAEQSAVWQYQLAKIYATGMVAGFPKNYTEAVYWYSRAAEQGHDGAQFGLGVLYHNGQGVPKNLVHAYHWLNLSAAQGYENAAHNRSVIEGQMTREQIAEAQKLSSDFRPTKEQ